MITELSPLWQDMQFISPLSEDRADRLVAFVAAGGDLRGTIVEVGCGWGELLLRAVEAAPGSTGLGIDLDAETIEHGVELAAERGLVERVRLVAGDAAELAPAEAAAVICVGANQVWGDHLSSLARLRAMVPTGARVIYADGVWSRPPTKAALDALGGPEEAAMGSLAELVDIAIAQRFRPYSVGEASQDEWDEFESNFALGYERWLAEHPADHPDAARVKELADSHLKRWLGGYRGQLGFGYLCLVAG